MSGKRGQVTIFIILAVVIIGLGILIYLLSPRIRTTIGGEESPEVYIKTCIEDKIKDSVEKASLQGGSINPVFFTLYENEKIEYLCYTGEYYRTCVIQQPMLKQHIEKEIKEEIEDDVEECFDKLKESYEKRRYEVSLKKGPIDVELLPKRIASTFNYTLTLTKAESERHDSFVVGLNNNLYEMISIANSILEWEALYGDVEVMSYMIYYKDLKVEKKGKSDGSKIYIITDRNTGNKLQFASRSVVWPPGLGT